MARPHKKKTVCCQPYDIVFGRWRSPYNDCRLMSLEMFETIRLLDHEHLNQDEAAALMGVSRTTVQRLYRHARSLIAGALVEGYHVKVSAEACEEKHRVKKKMKSRKDDTMTKVVFALEKEEIASHYEKATSFLLCTLENGKVYRKDRLIPETQTQGGCRRFMMSLGAEAFVAGSMSESAYARYKDSGMNVYEAKGDVGKAIEAFIRGELPLMRTLTDCVSSKVHEDGCCHAHETEKKHNHEGECCREE